MIHKIDIGSTIGDRFKVLRILGGEGRSGMGIVYVCYDEETRMIYALKTFQSRFLDSEEAKNRFKREALSWIELMGHPNIVHAYAVYEFEGQPYVALDFISPDDEGRNTLMDYLPEGVPLKLCIKWAIQFCFGMDHAATQGVTPHRDIKPDNLMITEDQNLKVADFGLARLKFGNWNPNGSIQKNSKPSLSGISNLSQAGTLLGAPPWIAPEQFEGRSDLRSDIYSFGIILYQMVTKGRVPFHAKTVEEFYILHKKDKVPDTNSEIESIIKRCLEKKPENRYQTFSEFRGELEKKYIELFKEASPAFPCKEMISCWEHFNKGLSFRNLGLLDDAIREYKIVVQENPTLSAAYTNLGAAYFKKALYEQAIQTFEKAIQIDNNNYQAQVNLGCVYFEQGILDRAVYYFKIALSVEPSDFKARNDLSVALYQQGFIEEAIAELKKAMEIKPGWIDGHKKLVMVLLQQGKSKEAAEEYKKMLTIDPNITEAHYGLGVLYESFGESKKAVEEFERVIEIDPQYFMAYERLGEHLSKNGLTEEAIKKFKKVIEINPAFAEAYKLLGSIYFDQQKFEDAINEFRKGVMLSENDGVMHALLGFALNQNEIMKEAIIELQRAISLNVSNDEVHLRLAQALIYDKQEDSGIEHLRKALSCNPENIDALLLLAMMLTRKNEYEEALLLYKRIVDLASDKNSKVYLFARKMIDDITGDLKKPTAS